jgi:hypothetical protein
MGNFANVVAPTSATPDGAITDERVAASSSANSINALRTAGFDPPTTGFRPPIAGPSVLITVYPVVSCCLLKPILGRGKKQIPNQLKTGKKHLLTLRQPLDNVPHPDPPYNNHYED